MSDGPWDGTDPPAWFLAKWRGDYAHIDWEEQRRCRGTGCPTRGPGLFIARNGAKHVVEHCLHCGSIFKNVPKGDLDVSLLPLTRDNTRDARACRHPKDEDVLFIAVDGRESWWTVCIVCGQKMRTCRPVIGGRLVGRVVDARVDDDGFAIAPPCEHCGAHEGTQLHHFGPRALFTDPDAWPTCYLCPPCHRIWHRVVTPELVHGFKDERQQVAS